MEVFFYAFLHKYDNFYTSNQFDSVFLQKFPFKFRKLKSIKIINEIFSANLYDEK